jgi:hypothetical protein
MTEDQANEIIHLLDSIRVKLGMIMVFVIAGFMFGVLMATVDQAEAAEDWMPAQDYRPCVGNMEFYLFDLSWKKDRLERYFETEGVLTEPGRWPVYTYKACAFPLSKRWVEVTYDLRTGSIALAQQFTLGYPDPNGRPRIRARS